MEPLSQAHFGVLKHSSELLINLVGASRYHPHLRKMNKKKGKRKEERKEKEKEKRGEEREMIFKLF